MIAVARILMPASMVRLSAGRAEMSDELQALCFLAGANSIFYGEKLLTTGNPDTERDQALFARLGIHARCRSPSNRRRCMRRSWNRLACFATAKQHFNRPPEPIGGVRHAARSAACIFALCSSGRC